MEIFKRGLYWGGIETVGFWIVRSSGINPSIKLDHSQFLLPLLELVTANGSTLTVAAPLTPFLL